MTKKVTCPRCGQEGWLLVRKLKNQLYVYVVHYTQGKHVHHYVGPARRNLELLKGAGIDIERVTQNVTDKVTQSVTYNECSEVTHKLHIPSWEEFKAFVEAKAREGDEDAQKLLKRMAKDKATIMRVLKYLSMLSQPNE
ncbi:MAG: hypothetical protein J7L91_03480 [Candidatus Korarchaeota archaeon]|nr:hypothetical protein [Candidatus Korarchaeota archaeon]